MAHHAARVLATGRKAQYPMRGGEERAHGSFGTMLGGHQPEGLKGAKSAQTPGQRHFPMGIPGTHVSEGEHGSKQLHAGSVRMGAMMGGHPSTGFKGGQKPSDKRIFDASLKDGSDAYRTPIHQAAARHPQAPMAAGKGSEHQTPAKTLHAKSVNMSEMSKRRGKAGRQARHFMALHGHKVTMGQAPGHSHVVKHDHNQYAKHAGY